MWLESDGYFSQAMIIKSRCWESDLKAGRGRTMKCCSTTYLTYTLPVGGDCVAEVSLR